MQIKAAGVDASQYSVITQLKKDGVYKRTCNAELQEEDFAPVSVTVTCGDATKLLKFLKFHGKRIGQIIHPVTLIGGGVGFHPKSLINGGYRFPLDWMIHQVRLSAEAMKTNVVSVYMHCPCGGCAKYGISIPMQVEMNLLGYGILKEHTIRDGFQITPYAHIYYGAENVLDTKEDETFELDAEAWFNVRSRYTGELQRLPQRLMDFPVIA